MKVNEPIGSELFAPLFIRLTLGTYLLLAGWVKLKNIDATVAEVQKLAFLPEHLATVFGILLPYAELAAGALIFLGLWTTLGGLIAALILGTFVYALGLFPLDIVLFNKDVILFAAAVSIMYSGGGALSIDRFRKSAKS
jgi:uncharacterized membrane protein YphA (DoxX/SURF4 family)